MTRALAIAALLGQLLVCNHAISADSVSPFDFKGITLNSNLETIMATGRFNCRPSELPSADTICSLLAGETETIAGATLKTYRLLFYDNKLASINLNFSPDNFPQVVDSLIAKYGAPKSRRTQILKNRMGASFENQILFWRNSTSEIMAARYPDTTESSFVTYSLFSWADTYEARAAKRTKDRAKDM